MRPEPERAELVLRAHGLTVAAAGRPVVGAADLELRAGEVVALCGPSGVGKSTLLRALCRLAELTPGLTVAGEVRLRGRAVYGRGVDGDLVRRRIGYLSQQPVVFPRPVLANVAFGLGGSRRERHRRAEEALVRCHLWREVEDRLDADARTLSVGQQQRLCLARALAVEPEVLLLDEPTSALDPEAGAAIEALCRELAAVVPMIVVTHDPDQARRVADRVLRLVPAPGGSRLVNGEGATTLGSLPSRTPFDGDHR